MNKENLYCIPFEKRLLRNSKGVSYHCERYDNKKTKDTYSRTSANLSKQNKILKDIQLLKSSGQNQKCEVCGRDFKDTRSMKIHKTKQNHHVVEKKVSAKKSYSKKEQRKRNRSYSMSPNEIRANKAMIR